jgi:hypothetical protein
MNRRARGCAPHLARIKGGSWRATIPKDWTRVGAMNRYVRRTAKSPTADCSLDRLRAGTARAPPERPFAIPPVHGERQSTPRAEHPSFLRPSAPFCGQQNAVFLPCDPAAAAAGSRSASAAIRYSLFAGSWVATTSKDRTRIGTMNRYVRHTKNFWAPSPAPPCCDPAAAGSRSAREAVRYSLFAGSWREYRQSLAAARPRSDGEMRFDRSG